MICWFIFNKSLRAPLRLSLFLFHNDKIFQWIYIDSLSMRLKVALFALGHDTIGQVYVK